MTDERYVDQADCPPKLFSLIYCRLITP